MTIQIVSTPTEDSSIYVVELKRFDSLSADNVETYLYSVKYTKSKVALNRLKIVQLNVKTGSPDKISLTVGDIRIEGAIKLAEELLAKIYEN